MSIVTHIQSLERKHAVLERLIDDETIRPMPDFTKMTQYKKQKLRIKEQMQSLQARSKAA